MIPFNKPVFLGTELEAMRQALVVNGHAAGNGPFTAVCEKHLDSLLGQRTLLVTSATHAMEMAALLLELKPGDEVILPSFTFVSTANAFAVHGARPVFADVDEHGNILPAEVERLRTTKTRAVVAVHYAGNSCDLDQLAAAAGELPIVEDAAQALTARYRGKPLGTLGAAGAFSFHETKNVGCGEGGALTIRNEAWRDRAEYIREKGTNRRKFQEGLVDKYTWVDLGSSYVLSDLNAAYLSTQLAEIDRIQTRRKQLHERYARELAADIEKVGAYAITHRADVTPNHHLFALVFREPQQRSRFIAHMREHQIIAPFHYVALHQSPMGQNFHQDQRRLPNTERLSSCLVRLPLFFNMTDDQQDEVIRRTREFLGAI